MRPKKDKRCARRVDESGLDWTVDWIGQFNARNYLFRLGRRARLKSPTWAVRSNNLVRDFASRLQGLQILFRNDRVETGGGLV